MSNFIIIYLLIKKFVDFIWYFLNKKYTSFNYSLNLFNELLIARYKTTLDVLLTFIERFLEQFYSKLLIINNNRFNK